MAREDKHIETPLEILVVDDSPIPLKISTNNFKLIRSNANIVSVSGGIKAVNLVRANPKLFDFILMDLQMPDMNGLDTIILIRQIEAQFGVKDPCIIVICTADHEGQFNELIEKYQSESGKENIRQLFNGVLFQKRNSPEDLRRVLSGFKDQLEERRKNRLTQMRPLTPAPIEVLPGYIGTPTPVGRKLLPPIPSASHPPLTVRIDPPTEETPLPLPSPQQNDPLTPILSESKPDTPSSSHENSRFFLSPLSNRNSLNFSSKLLSQPSSPKVGLDSASSTARSYGLAIASTTTQSLASPSGGQFQGSTPVLTPLTITPTAVASTGSPVTPFQLDVDTTAALKSTAHPKKSRLANFFTCSCCHRKKITPSSQPKTSELKTIGSTA